MINFKLFNLKINIKLSFFIVAGILIFLDFRKEFLMIFFTVTIHELSHVIVARLFGLKTDRIIITPLGEIAEITNLSMACKNKRILIILAGPAINFIIALVLLLADETSFYTFARINLCIACFNLLPVYPLDGGRLLQAVLSEKTGVLNANRIVINSSFFISIIMIFTGVIQAVLMPYNISLLCIGIYLNKTNRKEHLFLTFEFYKSVIRKKNTSHFLPIKEYVIDNDAMIKRVIERINYDCYMIVNVRENGVIRGKITEDEISNFIQLKGINYSIGEIYSFLFLQEK